jgi:hypothetical protein
MSVWWSIYCVTTRLEPEDNYVPVEELLEKGDLALNLHPDDLLEFIAFSSQTSSEVTMIFSESGLELPRRGVPRWVQRAYAILLLLHIPPLLPFTLGLFLLGMTRSWSWALAPFGAWLFVSLVDDLVQCLRSGLVRAQRARNRSAKRIGPRWSRILEKPVEWFWLPRWYLRFVGLLQHKLMERTVVHLAPRRWVEEAGYPVSFQWMDEPMESAYAPDGPGPVHDSNEVLASLEAMLEETRKRDDQLPKSYHFRIPLECFEVVDESMDRSGSHRHSMGWPHFHEAPNGQREVECWRLQITIQGKTYALEGGWDLCQAKGEDGQDVIDLRSHSTLIGTVTLEYPKWKLKDGPVSVSIAAEPASQWLYKYMLEGIMRVGHTALKHGWKIATCWS